MDRTKLPLTLYFESKEPNKITGEYARLGQEDVVFHSCKTYSVCVPMKDNGDFDLSYLTREELECLVSYYLITGK